MKRNMDTYRGRSRRKFTVMAALLMMFSMVALGQMSKQEEMKEVSKAFLQEWLVSKDIDGTLAFIGNEVAFPSCIVDKGQTGVKWGKTRRAVIKNLRPLLQLTVDDAKGKKLADIIERPKGILYSEADKSDFPRIDLGQDSALYDLYPINSELLKRILKNECKKRSDTESFRDLLQKHEELYMMVTNVRATEGGLTFIWAREGSHLRIITMDVRV